jgi:hypothetical protein
LSFSFYELWIRNFHLNSPCGFAVELWLPPLLFAILAAAVVIFPALPIILLVRTSLRPRLAAITIVRLLFRFIVGLIRHMSQERLRIFVLGLSGDWFA